MDGVRSLSDVLGLSDWQTILKDEKSVRPSRVKCLVKYRWGMGVW